MNKIILTILFILLLAVPSLAELIIDTAWLRLYAGQSTVYEDRALAMKLDGCGNVYVTGETCRTWRNSNWYTIKYDTYGNEVWHTEYAGIQNGHDWPYAIAVDDSMNVFITGDTWADTAYVDYATVKYDSSGNQLWVRTYNGPLDSTDSAKDIALDHSGNIYITGQSMGLGINWDYATIKYNSDGDTVWCRRYDQGGNEQALGIAVDYNENVYVTGTGGTVKYDANGSQLWVRGGARSAILLDELGYVYVTGSAGTTKYTPDGNELWSTSGYGVDVALDEFHNVYIVAGGPDYVTTKYDPDGDTVWVRKYAGPLDDKPHAITVDDLGNVYVTGASFKDQVRYDYVTIKYDSNGNRLWLHRFNGTAWRDDIPCAIAVDTSYNVYVTGTTETAFAAQDYGTIKYVETDVLRGDANRDEIIDLGDVIYIITYLYKGGSAPNPLEAGDANCEGGVDISDLVYLINFLFKEGQEPSCW